VSRCPDRLLSFDHVDAPYLRIAGAIRDAIRAGVHAPGEPLPSASALADEHGVRRTTVQHAIDVLRAEGLIETRPGAVATVRREPVRRRRVSRNRYPRARHVGGHLTHGVRREILGVGREEAPDRVTAAFGRPPGTVMVYRRRRLYDIDGPTELSVSWLLAEEFGGTVIETYADDLPRGLFLTAEEVGGRRYAVARDLVIARPATIAEAKALLVRAGSPVLDLTHIAMDAERRPIEVVQVTWPGAVVVMDDTYDVTASGQVDDPGDI
jgi:GntR family transcriptional regulator